MIITESPKSRYPMKVPFLLLYTGWTLIIGGIIAWSYQTIYNETFNLARREAYVGYEKDVMMRYWAALHGGVYVPVSEYTQPNPFLSHIKERDITSPSGKKFTLMNPAYITRQIHEISQEQFGIRAHITSLDPIRKENAPDDWETKALKLFEKGWKEYYGFDNVNHEEYFRFMAPLLTTEGCLKCHAAQGYKLGDIRGGISSSVPWKNYQASIDIQFKNILLGYVILWVIGLAGISLVRKKFIIYISQRDIVEYEIQKINEELRESKNIIEDNLYEKNKLIEELVETKTSLETIVYEKDKLFSIIAHDLKSPFQGLIGLTDIMSREIDSLEKEEIAEYSRSLHKKSKSIYKLLQNLLEWAQLQKGMITYAPQKINLNEVIQQNIDLINQAAGQKRILIESEIENGLTVFADESMLNSVLRNLLSNAVKFTPKGGRILISAKTITDKSAAVSIKDSGIGIPDELKKNIFKVGEKVGRRGTGGEESSGLGLLLCKEFVEKHGGDIWFDSREGEGSTFNFSLPVGSLE